MQKGNIIKKIINIYTLALCIFCISIEFATYSPNYATNDHSNPFNYKPYLECQPSDKNKNGYAAG